MDIKRVSDLGKKIKQIREEYGLTQKEFAKKLGVSGITIQKYEKGEREPSYTFLKRLEEIFGVDINWLFGKTKREEEEFVSVSLADVYASAGYGIMNQEKVKIIKLNKEFANMFFGIRDNRGYFVLYAYGDSMYPTISSGDICLGVFFEKENVLLDGNIYVFLYEDELFIKRLQKRKDGFVFKSDNPDYPSIELESLENVKIIGRILAVIRKV